MGPGSRMASHVFMKILESSPRRYDAGINPLSFGHINKIQQDIVENYITAGYEVGMRVKCGTLSSSFLGVSNYLESQLRGWLSVMAV